MTHTDQRADPGSDRLRLVCNRLPTNVRRIGIMLALIFVTTVLLLAGSGMGAAALPENTGSELTNTTSHPQIEDGLHSSEQTATSLTTHSDTNVTVTIEADSDRIDQVEQLIADNGVIETHYGGYVQATVNRSAVRLIAKHDAVRFVRRPITPQEGAVTSEGVETIQADVAHNRTETGQNATIAILDTGFNPSHAPISDNVVGIRDFTGSGVVSRDTSHGDATAEIVIDTAPNADVILVSASTAVEFAKAAAWVNEHDEIDIATASIGFYGLPNDGTSVVDDAINPGPQTDTAWFIATGNEADGNHWRGRWRNNGGVDDTLTFDGSGSEVTETNCFETEQPFTVILQWNDWSTPSEQYKLRLFRYNRDTGQTELVGSSDNQQNLAAPPVERINWAPSSTSVFCLSIVNNGADGTAMFDLFVSTAGATPTLEYTSAKGSVLVPATNRYGVGVGAIRWDTEVLEPYSSRGPTIDGRLKPEIVGPTGVSTVAYGTQAYFGTSAAAPHVSGAAAVVHSANRSAVGTDLQTRLLQTARSPTGTATGLNTGVGHGVVDVQRALPPRAPKSIAAPSSINTTNDPTANVTVTIGQSPSNRTVIVAVDDETGARRTAKDFVSSSNATATASVDIVGLHPGELTIRAKTIDEYGWSNPSGFAAPATTEFKPNNTEHTSGVSQALFDTVDQDNNNELSRSELRNMVESFVRTGEIHGISIDRTAVRNLVRFFIKL